MAKQSNKPNRRIIQRDEIGWFDIDAYTLAIMGYEAPGSERITLGTNTALQPADPTIADRAMEKLAGHEAREEEAEEQKPVVPGTRQAAKPEASKSKRLYTRQGKD